MKKDSPKLFSYPTNHHARGDWLHVSEPAQIFSLLHLVREPHV